MVTCSLGGVQMTTNPDQVRWNFMMKTAQTRTMGGKVIQILGTTLSDLTVQGSFGRGDRSKGDDAGWQNQLRFRSQVKTWANDVANSANPKPLRFVYPIRGWDFHVYVKSLSPVSHTVEDFNPSWQLVLFPVDDKATAIVKGIKDLYIKRLMDGVGWKQSDYNGPTQETVASTLSGLSVADYLKNQYDQAFQAGQQGATDGSVLPPGGIDPTAPGQAIGGGF